MTKFVPHSTANEPLAQDVRERIESLSFFAESLDSDLDSLLDVQLALASNRTNGVVRVLTLFSCFFLPITFIAGVYGMNFKFMPELDWPWGYALAILLMVLTVVIIFVWFRRRGWLRASIMPPHLGASDRPHLRHAAGPSVHPRLP